MPYYSYIGRDAQGASVRGVLEGADAGTAAGVLQGQGITPISIEPSARGPGDTAASLWEQFNGHKVTQLEVMLFSRQMHTLLKSGVPILRAFNGLAESTPNRAMRALLLDLRQTLESGRELSTALRKHNALFSNFYVSMVQIGELTGQLDAVFMQLYQHLEFEKFMREQVKAALRYPSFVIIAMMGAIMVINLFVIPAFSKIFTSFKGELPLLTRMLVGFSDFTVAWWPVILGGVFGGFWLFRRWANSPQGAPVWDRVKLELPIAGKIIRKATLARFARSMAIAGESGVPIVQGLATVATTVDNAHLARCIDDMRAGVERGESLLRTATATGVFTPVVLQMIAVGEESGALDDLMREIGEMYQQEVEYELKTLSAQIEPILIVFLGALVLMLALGVFLPIWDLGKLATKGG